MKRWLSTSTSACLLNLRPSAAVLSDVVESRRIVFGDVPGNGKRSGRKWLRRTLRGPSIKSWYGVHFTDVLPNFLSSEKEEVFLNEQQLNRVNKSGITGKMKPFAKPFVDNMLFEQGLDEILEDLEMDSSDALLTEDEIAKRESLINSADSAEKVALIEEMFDRLASEREEKRGEWEGKLSGGGSAAEREASSMKGPRKNDYEFRKSPSAYAGGSSPTSNKTSGEGLADSGDKGRAPASSSPGEALEKTSGSETVVLDKEVSGDPLSDLASVTAEFEIDESLTPEELSTAYEKFYTNKAIVEWKALEAMKEDPVLSTMWRDAVAVLEQQGLPLSSEGLAKIYLLDKDEDIEELKKKKRGLGMTKGRSSAPRQTQSPSRGRR